MNEKIIIAAIAGIVVIECMALYKGINGVVLTMVVGALAALIGKALPQLKLKKK